MLTMNILIFVMWLIVGGIVLIPKYRNVTKSEYALAWLVLMSQLLRNILCD